MLGLSSLSHAKPEQPFCTLTNKVRGKYICKDVFLRLSACVCLCHCVLIIVSLWCCRWAHNTSNGNEGVLHILQISKPGASLSDCLVSYPGHSLEESYSSAETQSVDSTAPANWAMEKSVRKLEIRGRIKIIHDRKNCQQYPKESWRSEETSVKRKNQH